MAPRILATLAVYACDTVRFGQHDPAAIPGAQCGLSSAVRRKFALGEKTSTATLTAWPNRGRG